MSIWSKIFNKITFKDYPDTTTPLNSTNLNTMTDAIDGLDDRVLQLLGDFASQYDNSATYSVGDYAIYDGMLYKCITAITVAEEWDSSKWQQTDCGSEFSELNSNLGTITEQNDNYIILGNYGIAWGTDVSLQYYSADLFHRNINLPLKFIDTNYVVNLLPIIALSSSFRGELTMSFADKNVNYFTARAISKGAFASDSVIGCDWIAIGRVK